MDQIKIGKFISETRKEIGITQEQLAEKLGVSKNAVSKWERGINLPDASLMVELCKILNISLNELFAGEHLQENEVKIQSEKNILNIFQFSTNKNKKYKFLIAIILTLFIIPCFIIGKEILMKKGYLLDNNLKWTQLYISGKDNIKGDVDINRFISESLDFDIGANQYGYAVFKNPKQAFLTFKKKYAKGIQLIQKEFHLNSLNNFNFHHYKTYGWQVTTGTEEEQRQAHFVSSFLDIYENSFQKRK